ncbi:MAG: zinc ribbon domain-containing protein, partial [Betaproteobacteria bacterium]
MKFCSLCGHSVRQQIPENDNRQRFVCQQCG